MRNTATTQFEDQDRQRRQEEAEHARQALSAEIATAKSVEELRDVITPLIERGILIRRRNHYEAGNDSYEPVSEAANQKQRELSGIRVVKESSSPIQEKFEQLRKATRIVPSKTPKKNEVSIVEVMDPFVRNGAVLKAYKEGGKFDYWTTSEDRQIQRLVNAANKRKNEIEAEIESRKTKKRFEEIKNDPKGFVQENKAGKFAYKIEVTDKKHHRLIKVTDLAVAEGEADIEKGRFYVPGAMETGKEIPHYLIRAAEEVDRIQAKKREKRKKQKAKKKKKN